MKTDICCVFNYGAHYRKPIFKLIDKVLKCDFYIGDKVSTPIKKMNYNDLKGFKEELLYQPLVSNFYWQKGCVKLCFKPYKHYIMTGEPYCISTWLALILNRVLGKKTYLWTHGWYGDETRVKKYIKKIFFKLSDHILLYGNYAKNIMIQEGFIESKLSVIYNSLDYDQQIAIRKKLAKSSVYLEHFKNNYPNLIYIGRIQPVKRLDLLVIAVKRLESIGVKCNLIIVGEPLKNYSIVEHILNNDLMDRVWLYGPCYDEEKIGELIYNADICVSPGNVGLTAIHSLMYGTPIITHNNFCSQMPEFEAISEGVTGGFFIENDVYDLCCKISHWLKYLESNKGKTQSEAYRIIDTKYNPHYQIRLLESIIKN